MHGLHGELLIYKEWQSQVHLRGGLLRALVVEDIYGVKEPEELAGG